MIPLCNCGWCGSKPETLSKGYYGLGARCPNKDCISKVLIGEPWFRISEWNKAQGLALTFRYRDYLAGFNDGRNDEKWNSETHFNQMIEKERE